MTRFMAYIDQLDGNDIVKGGLADVLIQTLFVLNSLNLRVEQNSSMWSLGT